MAEVVTAPINWRSRNGGTYPWDQYFDGQQWALTAGSDFMCKPSTLQANASATARARGGKVRTKRDGDVVYIQYVTA